MAHKKANSQTQEENWNEKGLTGYPSIDKPWLKYYSKRGYQYAVNLNIDNSVLSESLTRYLWI